MRKLLTLSFLLVLASALFGQIYNPVKWSFSSNQLNGSEFNLVYTATIEKGWYVYSQYLESEDGPVKTSFNYDKGSHFSLVGKNTETSDHRKELNDPLFDNMRVIKFSDKVVFTQKVKVTDFSKPISGYLEFMTCNNERCLPPTEVDFSFSLKPADAAKPAEPAADKAGQKDPAKPAATANEPTTTVATPTAPAETPALDVPDASGNFFDPVNWTATVRKTAENELEIVYKATIQPGWSVYSQFVGADGPEPTAFTYESAGQGFELLGKAEETSAHKIEGHDPIFDMKLTKFKEEVSFTQKIKITDPTKPITGYVTYMTCDDTKCLPPTDEAFKIDPATASILLGDAAKAGETVAGIDLTEFLGCDFKLDKSQLSDCGVSVKEEGKGLLSIFILGFFGGLLALLTPCVFPMIPLTVSFFTKGSENRKKGLTNAFLYGFFILLVYLILSLPFHLLDSVNPDILNDISTNVWLNIAFFVIFMVFAISFFGYFEITLPSSWVNKASSAEGVGGIVGVFFMALTLALVSFSCTGPILGSLLAGALSSDGGAVQLTAGMAGFGFALALPFGLFAAFPSWMSSLPKSGGWMTTVKVVLGFLEVALALKFLSNADLVKKWGLLKIEPFLVLWILIALAMGIYLLGKIKFPHDSPIKKLHPARIVLAILAFAFAGYMATGLTYDEKAGSLKPLKLLSGLAPPSCYSWFYHCDCPQNLSCFKDFCEGVAYARKVNKPIMIDFTGHACVNCRKMEEHVWPEPEVYKYLKDEYVVISLYVDEKIDLPADQQKTVAMKSGGTRRLRNVGHRWAHFQAENFDNNSQPQYVLLSPNGQMLNQPVAGIVPVNDYAEFLKCGLDKFKELSR